MPTWYTFSAYALFSVRAQLYMHSCTCVCCYNSWTRAASALPPLSSTNKKTQLTNCYIFATTPSSAGMAGGSRSPEERRTRGAKAPRRRVKEGIPQTGGSATIPTRDQIETEKPVFQKGRVGARAKERRSGEPSGRFRMSDRLEPANAVEPRAGTPGVVSAPPRTRPRGMTAGAGEAVPSRAGDGVLHRCVKWCGASVRRS